MSPSADVLALSTTEVDISKVQPGQGIKVSWRKQPVFVRNLTPKEIAEAAFVSETTVKTHVAHILMKLHLRDRVQAVVFAYENGVVAPGSS